MGVEIGENLRYRLLHKFADIDRIYIFLTYEVKDCVELAVVVANEFLVGKLVSHQHTGNYRYGDGKRQPDNSIFRWFHRVVVNKE